MADVDLQALEQRALALMKRGDFGPEAVQVNRAIVDAAPADRRAWTRLGRCHLESRQFDEAVTALRTALALDPVNTVATNLLSEVRKRRALTPSATARASTGFTAREFAQLETLSAEQARDALRPRIEALLDSVNASPIAARIVAARQRRGEIGARLFHANGVHAGDAGHLFAFHHGGRWEPQFNIGWFASPRVPSSMRIGIGFNVASGGSDHDRADGERVLQGFERFQRSLARSWRQELARWMSASGGFIQFADNPPAIDMPPQKAVDWLIACHNAAALGWVFVGRWLFLDRPDAAAVLADRAKLAAVVDDTFRTLFPLWLAAYE